MYNMQYIVEIDFIVSALHPCETGASRLYLNILVKCGCLGGISDMTLLPLWDIVLVVCMCYAW
jgi:hypothetical protein